MEAKFRRTYSFRALGTDGTVWVVTRGTQQRCSLSWLSRPALLQALACWGILSQSVALGACPEEEACTGSQSCFPHTLFKVPP